MASPAPADPARRFAIEARVLLAVAIVAGGLLTLLLAIGAATGGTHRLDRAILLTLRGATDGLAGWRPILRAFMLDMTALGDPPMLTMVVLLVAGYLFTAKRGHLAWLVIASTAAGSALGALLKSLFARARPDVVPHLVEVRSLSFPSGHAMQSAVIYLSLAAMIARTERSGRVRGYVLSAAVTLVMLVGLSRLYLGVHWPTDVLAGWTAGASWAFGTALLTRRLQARHEVEPPA